MQIVVTGGIAYKEKDFIRDCLTACIVELPALPTFRVREFRDFPDGIVAEYCKEYGVPLYEEPRVPVAMTMYYEFDVPTENARLLADAELVLAFPGGQGTANCVNQATNKGITIIVFGPDVHEEWRKNARYRKYKL